MRTFLITILFTFHAIGCSSSIQLYHEPIVLDDGITTTSLTKAGFDSSKTLELIKKIEEDSFPGVHGVLIAKGNKLVLEKYYEGYDHNKPHLFYSAAKVITSMVFGLAYDHGLLNPEDKVVKFYEPYYPTLKNFDKRKENIKFKNLLTMSAGIECGTFGDNKTDINRRMIRSFHPVRLFLDQPMAFNPGEFFEYTDANIEVVATAVAAAIGDNYDEFERKAFFEPLRIQADNYHKGYKPRDFLKIGMLFQNKGIWNGHRVLSEEWINEATSYKIKPNVPSEIADGYGYYWWLKEFDYKDRKVKCFFAAGNGHQYLYVIPELELVVVFTGGNFDADFLHMQPHLMLQEYIINSIHFNGAAYISLQSRQFDLYELIMP